MQSLFSLIESLAFDAATSVASDLRTMLTTASGQLSGELVQAAARSPQNRLLLAQRVLSLCERDVDVRYQNRYDTAVTVYLWILSMTDDQLARAVATRAIGLRNGWWAPRLARLVLADRKSGSDADTDTVIATSSASRIVSVAEPGADPEIAAHGFARYLQQSPQAIQAVRGSLDLPSQKPVNVGRSLTVTADSPTDDVPVAA